MRWSNQSRSGACVMSTEVQSGQLGSSRVQGIKSNEVHSGQANPDQVHVSCQLRCKVIRSSQVRCKVS